MSEWFDRHDDRSDLDLDADFAGVLGSALLANGHPVDITSATIEDLGRVRDFYTRLSDMANYFRFFGIRRAIPDAELRRIVLAGRPQHVTLLASIGDELIGIGEYIETDRPAEAEVAFVVADDHHREGIATLLLERLAVIGRRRGLQRFTATTLPGNADMQLVFRTVGLTEQHRFDDGMIDVVLDLTDLHELEAQAALRREHSEASQRAALT